MIIGAVYLFLNLPKRDTKARQGPPHGNLDAPELIRINSIEKFSS